MPIFSLGCHLLTLQGGRWSTTKMSGKSSSRGYRTIVFLPCPRNFPQAYRPVAKCTGHDRCVRRNVQSTPANGFLNRGDVDFLHQHHRFEGAFGFVAARTQGIGQDRGRDLP
jgi:hypothetical protein